MKLEVNWNEAIADIGPPLYRFFLASCEVSHAEDLVQETLIRLLDKVDGGKFDPARGNLRMYAFGIAHFVRIENRRILPTQEYSEDRQSQAMGPEEAIAEERSRQRLRRAIATLSEPQQQVIGLYMNSEFSFNEIATILGMPAATVRSHLHRAKESLKIKLGTSKEVGHE